MEAGCLRRLLEAPDLENSYEDWHVRGVDYLCLLRTPALTIKAYVFGDCAVNSLGGIVWPHNHRYSFWNHTIAGRIVNFTYRPSDSRKDWCVYDCYPQRQVTSAFTHLGLTAWRPSWDARWSMTPSDVHAIRADPGSVAIQYQTRDELEPWQATGMWVPIGCRPECAPYRKMSAARADEVRRIVGEALCATASC